jgi:hypothetical protein
MKYAEDYSRSRGRRQFLKNLYTRDSKILYIMNVRTLFLVGRGELPQSESPVYWWYLGTIGIIAIAVIILTLRSLGRDSKKEKEKPDST